VPQLLDDPFHFAHTSLLPDVRPSSRPTMEADHAPFLAPCRCLQLLGIVFFARGFLRRAGVTS
jgi:hypothetical protein